MLFGTLIPVLGGTMRCHLDNTDREKQTCQAFDQLTNETEGNKMTNSFHLL